MCYTDTSEFNNICYVFTTKYKSNDMIIEPTFAGICNLWKDILDQSLLKKLKRLYRAIINSKEDPVLKMQVGSHKPLSTPTDFIFVEKSKLF